MDSAEAESLRSRHGHSHSGIDQRMALPNLRIRALSPRQRHEKERQPVRDAILCLQPVQRHVSEPDSVQCIQHRSAERRVPTNRDALVASQVISDCWALLAHPAPGMPLNLQEAFVSLITHSAAET